MKRSHTCTLLLALGVAPAVVTSDSMGATGGFTVEWTSLDGGSGDLSSASFSLHGTAGQPDSGEASGPTWSVSGGVEGAGGSPPPCPEDLNGSGAVDFGDLLAILSAWGPCNPECPEDLDFSGDVGFGDLLPVLLNWGPCP